MRARHLHRRPSTRPTHSTGEAHVVRQMRRLQAYVAGPLRPFRTDARLLDVAATIHAARGAARETDSADVARRLIAAERAATARMHEAMSISRTALPLAGAARRHRLDRTDTECLLFLALASLGQNSLSFVGEVLQSLAPQGGDAIRIVRALSSGGRLARSALVCIDEEDDALNMSQARLHPDLLASLLGGQRGHENWWDVKTQTELFAKFRPLVRALVDVAEQLVETDEPTSSKLARAVSRRDRLIRALCGKLRKHDWALTEMSSEMSTPELAILLLLIGQELGLGKTRFNAFAGRALAASASDDIDGVVVNLAWLKPTSYLRRKGLVRVFGGEGDLGSIDDMGALATCTFELTQRAAKLLDLSTALRKRAGLREPVVRLEQLVLPERVLAAVNMAAAQARHADVLFRRWGLGDTIAYGRGTTLLLSGPPGTGKTATAEALAHELGRQILAVNAAELQSCWVGETEKAIVRTFREAGEAGAVLFWDEADAFFHDRDVASRQWEVREVNVLLQEIERFDGVCILATNRKTSLDAALERRVSMKIEFERPDRAMARSIWQKLLPTKLPLAPDVDLDTLAAADLSGGQIKNVVLNAARRALARGPRAKVCMRDFEDAVCGETEGQWAKRDKLGFGA